MWSRTAARILMSLTKVEREAINDSVLKIQSIETSLGQVEETKIPGLQKIYSCLGSVQRRLRIVLRGSPEKKKPPAKR